MTEKSLREGAEKKGQMPGSESEKGEMLASQIQTTEVWRVLWELLGAGSYDITWLKEHATEDSNFVSDLSMDSLNLLEFFLRLEDHFHVTIVREDYAKLTSVKAIGEFLKTKVVQS